MAVTQRYQSRDGSVERIEVAWVADGSGDAAEVVHLNGPILRLVTVPATDTEQPDDNYDVTVIDDHGIDLLGGDGADRDETNAEAVDIGNAGTYVFYAGPATVTVANAGAANEGTVYLYVLNYGAI